ncbi:putative N-terminal acetyltransferase 2 [Golovinomyces cichoracearum]|uniref:Putative N-terminal acetyltransferase 2 n=1 Tax=Golovinomyces cichoracearum TaxID=62708 RepID=A0A420HFR6_9PEZI|nr:putative N-terminal acetyltransferase 2 [Golovinomyces cichoracearum]
MLPEAIFNIVTGVVSMSSPLRGLIRKSGKIRATSSRGFSQRTKSFGLFRRTTVGRKTTTSQIISLLNRKNSWHRQLHGSFKMKTQKPSAPKSEDLKFGARLRKLSREYGWAAFGVYLTLSALDFPLCYLMVRFLGPEKIGEWEETVISGVKSLIPEKIKMTYDEWHSSINKVEVFFPSNSEKDDSNINNITKTASNQLEEAKENHKKDASLATQLALAYAIHKSFIFVRVPITAAITPKIVKILRGWGWDIGKRTTKEEKAFKRAALRLKSQSPVAKKKVKKLSRFAKFARLERFSSKHRN